MKQLSYFFILIVLIFLSNYTKAEIARVVTKENAIREDCRFYSPVIAKVTLNDELEIIKTQGDWYKVGYQGSAGCIHESAIDKKYISLSSIDETNQTSTSVYEISLAGKGFLNVEQNYKNRNPKASFAIVKEIEDFEISDQELTLFVQNGKLRLP